MTREDVIVSNKHVDIYDLEEGDFFVEESHPEVYKVLEIFEGWRYNRVYEIYYVRDMKSNKKEEWFHDDKNPWKLFKVKPK